MPKVSKSPPTKAVLPSPPPGAATAHKPKTPSVGAAATPVTARPLQRNKATPTAHELDAAPIAVESPSRRVRKRERTRRLIREAAIALFREKGFENVTIVAIAEAADVDVTTFWRHFGSKHALLYADQEDWLAGFRHALDRQPPDLAPVTACLNAFFEAAAVGEPEIPELRAELHKASPSPEVQAAILAFEDLVRRELEVSLAHRLKREAARDPVPAVLAGAIIAAARWMRERISQSRDGDIDTTSWPLVGEALAEAGSYLNPLDRPATRKKMR